METLETTLPRRPGMLKRLYDWVLSWAETPYGTPALFALAFAESSFFPIPPDVLLLALALAAPTKAFRFALVCTAGSVLGGIAGYYIGMLLFDQVAAPILDFYHAMDKFEIVRQKYQENTVLALGAAGFTPIPYKVFTIAAGACDIKLPTFIWVSAVSRGARFFLISGLIWKFGPSIKSFIDRYFNLLTIVFLVLLVLGFAVAKLVL
ncbi:MAG: DedA family protein [Myxococcales bacterium]|nr:DedA family protein [Myxococcales bacterium]